MTITLRPHQVEAVDALFSYFGERSGHPLVVLPTASGKSYVIAAFCRRAIEEHPGTRILIATHRAELIEQDARAIQTYWPEADVGIYSAGLGQRRIRPITVAGVQSIAHVESLPAFDLVVIDECHLVPKDGDGYYRSLFARLEALNPDVKRIGLTATPYRLSGGRLTHGEGKMFTSICYELPVQRLVDEGMLAPLVSPQGGTGPGYDTHKVKTSGGDFAANALADTLEAQHAVTRAALEEAARLAVDRKSWLVFCVSVEHARQAAECLFALGISSAIVTGEDDMGARRAKIEAFRCGEVRALVNCEVLTTGFDAPRVDCIVLLRPTQSTGLYVQICGRGMRLSPDTGKADCLVLDYGGNIERHGPITDVKPKESRETLSPKIKICPSCDAEVKVWARECGECGFIFPLVPREVAHDKAASKRAVMGPAPEPEWIETPSGFSMERWEKKPTDSNPNPPPTVVVKYHTGNLAQRDHREWICPEHGGFARGKFERWWHEHGGVLPWPADVEEAIERQTELRYVEAIAIEPDGKFSRITQVRFAAPREPREPSEPSDKAPPIDFDLDPWGNPYPQAPVPFDNDDLPF